MAASFFEQLAYSDNVQKMRGMAPGSGSPDQRPNRKRRLALVLAVLLSLAASGWVCYGPHRRVADRLLEEGARRGLLVEGGNRAGGRFSTRLRNVRLSLRGNHSIAVEIGRIDIEHWPLMRPHISIDGADVHLRGEPVVLLDAVARAWYSPEAKLAYRPLEITYEHRLLGQVHLSGVALQRRGDLFEIEAGRARVGDVVWRDVKLSLERRNPMLVVGLGAESGHGRVQLACFPAEGETSRWLLDLPHGPVRPLLDRLGAELGDDFAATQLAGSVSLDIPEDTAQPVRGRVQMVVDGWPLYAPAGAEPMLGSTFSLLSNVVASADGSHWELPRVELTMPVFSLAGKGSIQFGRGRRLVLEAEGERTCRQLRALLPPSRPLENVRQFLDGHEAESPPSGKHPAATARLWVRWDTGSGMGLLRPEWRFSPGCGLDPWPPGG